MQNCFEFGPSSKIDRGHNGVHLSEINFNLEKWSRRFLLFLALAAMLSVEQNNLCNFSRGY